MARVTTGLPGAAALAAEVADELLLGTVRDTHLAIARRTKAPLKLLTGGRRADGPAPHDLHESIAGTIYAGIGGGLRGAAKGLRSIDRFGPRLEDTSKGRFVSAAVNGLIGDTLDKRHPELLIEMAVRHDGKDVLLTPDGLTATFPDATGQVAIFVHGLCENEAYWNRAQRFVQRPLPDEPRPAVTYADTLSGLGWTPVFLRMNSGLPVLENSVGLASLIDRLVTNWPTDVRRIALVGHSMGALISRAACVVALDPKGSAWTDRVTNIVTLGAPHLGSGVERAAFRGARALGMLPESAAFGRILDIRAVGILDLRHGLAPETANLPHARYHLVAATLSRSARHPVAATVGDLLVNYRSATGQPARGRPMFPGADVLHVGGSDHFDLLNHELVHDALKEWLA